MPRRTFKRAGLGSNHGSGLKGRPLNGPALIVALVFVALLALGAAGALPGIPGLQGAQEPARLSERQTSWTEWDPSESPDYYRVVGSAVVDVELEPGEARYEGLDSLGRTGRAAAVVTFDMMREGTDRERADISDIHPAGWGHNEEVDIVNPDGSTYHGALFNRSHLLAKSLGGDDAAYNLVTGTRTQNVGDNTGQNGGMAYTEGLARDWLWDNRDGTVYYSATPVYEGDELLPRSVIVDVLSSDGELDLEVEVYNAVNGYEVDYATGEFRPTGE